MCGIFAITGTKKAAQIAHVGLFSLQHRGQESAGIVTADKGELLSHTGMGLVSKVFNDRVLSALTGTSALSHVRYSTTGESQPKNAQPLVLSYMQGSLAVAHNGNLTNGEKLKKELEKKGAIFQSSTDSEVIVHLMAKTGKPLEQALAQSLKKLVGAYSFVFLTTDKMVAVRDPLGFRPLVLGKLGKAFIFSSETPAIEVAGGKVIRDVEPGEMIVVKNGKLKSYKPFKKEKRTAVCIFEQVYFSRPDSFVLGKSVGSARFEMGRHLAMEMNFKADAVVPVPDSGLFAAMGLSAESGIPFTMGFMRNHYVGRSFIKPTQQLREMTTQLKLAPIKDMIKGKDIILVDDSIVRGTTSRKVVATIKKAGARKVFMALSSPPITSSCFYGIDTPKQGSLIASTRSVREIQKFLGVDGLCYLSIESMIKAAGGGKKTGFCTACFDRKYPTKIFRKT
jgi:amidophosphoribosyltransferase